MKQLIIIIASISLFSTANSQTDSLSNFILSQDLTVKYQYIFTQRDTLDIKDLNKFIASKSNINNVATEGNTITGNITNMRVNYEKYGGKYMSTLIILNHDLNANFIIELKGNRYRLTIKDMVFTDKESLMAYDTANSDVNQTKLEDMVVKKRKQTFKTSGTITKGLSYTNQHFKDTFTYITPKKEDW